MATRTIRNTVEKGTAMDTMFIHYSPPRLVEARRWARGGDVDRLQRAALGGHGSRLMQLRLAAPAARTKAFLNSLPGLVEKCESLHATVTEGKLDELKSTLETDNMRKRLALCRDRAGVGLLHKAVYYDYVDIVKYFIDNYPTTVHMRDSEGRTPLHYAAMSSDPSSMSSLLISAGAERAPQDIHQRTPTYYQNHTSTLELPVPSARTPSNSELVIKPSNIRIWCHDRDLGRLQQVVWKGEGARLRTEVSSQPTVKRFLEAVPHIMGTIKEIHSAVIDNDLPRLTMLTEDPIPPIIITSKDLNGLTPLHKAAGLGHVDVAEFILSKYPELVHAIDNEGRTALHWTALPKNGDKIFHMLLANDAQEGKVDFRMKSMGFYKNRPNELDKSLLKVLPDAPRTANPSYPASWDWELLKSGQDGAKTKKAEEKSDDSNKENTEATDEQPSGNQMEDLQEEDSQPEEYDFNSISHLARGTTAVKENHIGGTPIENNIPDVPSPPPPPSPPPQAPSHRPSSYVLQGRPKTTSSNYSNEDREVQSRGDNRSEGSDAPRVEDDDTEEQRTDTATTDPNLNPGSGSGNKDDDDVYVPGENESEYGDVHKADTADVLDIENLKRNLSSAGDTDGTGRRSQGSESTIEGVVNADPEVDSLDAEQKENQPKTNDEIEDEEVHTLIENCNMEQLAALVLNGEGERLVGQMSQNTELQVFLDNVPSYMNKIKRVHLAARSGGLRELQAALDRRKFAIARDRSSPRGATPLHVAVIFGKTPILRYLAARFPETLSAVDFDGRTALHYAAILNDNGHYYNLLQNMGANPKDQDDQGHTPEDFQKSDKYLTHNDLLRDFGADENILDGILSDKVIDDQWSARRDLADADILNLLERSFQLLQDTNLRSANKPPPSASANQGLPTSFLGRFLTRQVFDKIKHRITKFDHNLFDLIWPAVKKIPNNKNALNTIEEDFNGGVVAPDFYAYPVFEEFLLPLIKDLHCINIYSELQDHPESLFLPQAVHKENNNSEEASYLTLSLDLDPPGRYILTGTIECSRNLKGFELPLNMNVGQLEAVERALTTVVLSKDFSGLFENRNTSVDEPYGIYYTMNEVLENPSEIRAILAASGLLIPLCDTKDLGDDQRLHGRHWPYARGVYVAEDSNLAIWINVQDHLRIVSCTSHNNPAEIGKAYTNISKVMIHLNDHLKYVCHEKLGYLSARPSFLGNSLHFSLTIQLPYLSKEPDHLKHLCTVRGLNYRETSSPDIVKIGNYQSLGLTELQTFHDFTTAITNLMQLEKDLAMQNSLHIAEMFVNIFRKKRRSLINANY